MVATPSRTQSITPYMNRRIMQPTPGIQIGDLSKEKDDACTEHISRILLTLSTSPLDCGWKDVLIADIVSLTGRKDPWLLREKDLYLGFCNFSLIFWLSHLVIVQLNLIFKSLRDHQIARKTWETSSRFNFLNSSERAGWISWIMRLLQKDWRLRHRPWQWLCLEFSW